MLTISNRHAFLLCMSGLAVPDQINLSVQAYPWKGGSTEPSEPSLDPLLDYEHSMTTGKTEGLLWETSGYRNRNTTGSDCLVAILEAFICCNTPDCLV